MRILSEHLVWVVLATLLLQFLAPAFDWFVSLLAFPIAESMQWCAYYLATESTHDCSKTLAHLHAYTCTFLEIFCIGGIVAVARSK